MANAERGEVALEAGGRTVTLCLTLGALAEIEAGLGAEGLEALGARLRRMTAADLALVLGALAKGGGEAVDPAALKVAPGEAARAVALAFERAFA
jgi:hypothetical protein